MLAAGYKGLGGVSHSMSRRVLPPRDSHPRSLRTLLLDPASERGFNLSDREKTAIDCVDRPDLCGGLAEAAYIFGQASWKWTGTEFPGISCS